MAANAVGRAPRRITWIAALLGGPSVSFALLIASPPDGLSTKGWAIAAIALWMAIWWMTEAIPLAATALLPLVLFPMLGIDDLSSISQSYAHPLVFLFLGGFLLARAVTVWGLDRRIALQVLHLCGPGPRRIMAGIMLVTAFLSMWVSNTATAMMMLPIALSIIAAIHGSGERGESTFPTALLLAVAYAASIGGMGTLVGTPPNALFAAYMANSQGMEIGFAQWMVIGLPLVMLLLPLAWLCLVRTFRVPSRQSEHGASAIESLRNELPPISPAERMVAAVVGAVAVCWVGRPLLEDVWPDAGVSDPGIALVGAIVLFAIPVDLRQGRFLLNWNEAATIRWDVLILFGGGLALAATVADSDLTAWLAERLAGLGAYPVLVALCVLGLLMVVVGELASNTAMAAVFLPLAGVTAVAMGEPAWSLALPAALFATLGFMLPVGTPPNAVVFGSGVLSIKDMVRAGAILDLAGVFVVAAFVTLFGEALWTLF